jgi:hypothetical protein
VTSRSAPLVSTETPAWSSPARASAGLIRFPCRRRPVGRTGFVWTQPSSPSQWHQARVIVPRGSRRYLLSSDGVSGEPNHPPNPLAIYMGISRHEPAFEVTVVWFCRTQSGGFRWRLLYRTACTRDDRSQARSGPRGIVDYDLERRYLAEPTLTGSSRPAPDCSRLGRFACTGSSARRERRRCLLYRLRNSSLAGIHRQLSSAGYGSCKTA